MKKNIILIVFALLLLGGCKKDKDVRVAKVQAETPDVTTTANTADISGTYSYASTLKSVVIVYGKDASLSSPQKATAEHTWDSYSVTINNLDPGTTYYYYCIFDTGYGATEGEHESFITQGGGGGDHEYVDLGLPSGLLWATCNVGADSPEDYGDHFAWGETEQKSIYDLSTYKWCNGSETSYTKYNTDSNCGIVDNKTVLDPEDDAAHVNWGGAWRMPTREEMQELEDNCTSEWTTQNGVKGRRVTGPNGKSIFLPAAGYYNGDSLYYAGFVGYYNGDTLYYESLGTYWSSLLSTDDPCNAYYLYFSNETVNTNLYCGRCYGLSVRPVYGSQNVSVPTVTTASVSNITQTTATCGGNVTSGGGTTVTARGVCWSTSPNPTVSNSHTTNGSGTGSFTSNITGLTANTKYYVRAYATNSAGTSYGEQESFTTLSQTQTFTVNGVSFEMIAVEGGTFTMGATSEQGSDAWDDEFPTHSVTLSDYYIGKFEVTQELWEAVMGSNPSYFYGSNHPVEKVNWNDCQEFITKLNGLTGKNFRLPTEAEWEYAARGGNRSGGYKYSGSNNINDVAWYDNNSGSKTHAVGTKSPNELGIYDMSGNVDEWCQDWYGSYSSGSQTNPQGPSSGSYRVNRGGGWYISRFYCRVSYRDGGTPDFSCGYLGLRLAL